MTKKKMEMIQTTSRFAFNVESLKKTHHFFLLLTLVLIERTVLYLKISYEKENIICIL